MTLAIVETDKAWLGILAVGTAIGGYDIREAIPVEIGQRYITRAPTRLAERAGLGKVSLPIVQVQELAIRLVVADDDVQIPIAIDIGERRRIRAIRGGSQVA